MNRAHSDVRAQGEAGLEALRGQSGPARLEVVRGLRTLVSIAEQLDHPSAASLRWEAETLERIKGLR